MLGCSPTTIRLRESGHQRITELAAQKLSDAVHAAALAKNQQREARRRRARERREEREGMTTDEFLGCKDALGWTYREMARYLAGDDDPEAMGWVTGWARGTIVPHWVARDLRTALNLGPADNFPTRRERRP